MQWEGAALALSPGRRASQPGAASSVFCGVSFAFSFFAAAAAKKETLLELTQTLLLFNFSAEQFDQNYQISPTPV